MTAAAVTAAAPPAVPARMARRRRRRPARRGGQPGRGVHPRGEALHAFPEQFLHVGAHLPGPLRPVSCSSACCQPSASSRSRRSPRDAADLTVPSGQPSAAAVSASVSCSQYRQHQHRPLPRRQLHQQPHQRVAQVDLGGRGIGGRPGFRAEQEQLALQPALPPEPVGGQVVQRAAQVGLGVTVERGPVPQQPFQRGLQQVLAGLAAAGEQHRGAQQLVGPVGEEALQLRDHPVICHRLSPFRLPSTTNLAARSLCGPLISSCQRTSPSRR